MTLAEYARLKGVSRVAVWKAANFGRLKTSVGRDKHNRLYIADVAKADLAWEGRRAPAPRAVPPAELGELADIAAPGASVVPPLAVSIAIREAAQARKEIARAALAEQEVIKRSGQVISIVEATDSMRAAYTIVKNALLGVPSRLAQRMPEMMRAYPAAIDQVDALIREALEELHEQLTRSGVEK